MQHYEEDLKTLIEIIDSETNIDELREVTKHLLSSMLGKAKYNHENSYITEDDLKNYDNVVPSKESIEMACKYFDCKRYPLWDNNTYYNGGEIVIYNGVKCVAMNGICNIPKPINI
jgi:hypothetical protein